MRCRSIKLDMFVCPTDSCPPGCQCNQIPYTSETYVGCNTIGMQDFPVLSTNISTPNITVNLTDNDIQKLDRLLKKPSIYDKITSLILSNNNISTITKDDLPNSISHKLYLDGNNIRHLDGSMLQMMGGLSSIKLGNNNFDCQCDTLPLYIFSVKNRKIIEKKYR